MNRLRWNQMYTIARWTWWNPFIRQCCDGAECPTPAGHSRLRAVDYRSLADPSHATLAESLRRGILESV